MWRSAAAAASAADTGAEAVAPTRKQTLKFDGLDTKITLCMCVCVSLCGMFFLWMKH